MVRDPSITPPARGCEFCKAALYWFRAVRGWRGSCMRIDCRGFSVFVSDEDRVMGVAVEA